MQIVKNKGRRILVTGVVLAILTFVASIAIACNGVIPGELVDHVAHLARDVCGMASSVELLTYAVIGLFVVSVVSLIVSVVKRNK
jgi:hypothetical protein